MSETEFYGLTVTDLADYTGEDIEGADVKRAQWCLRSAAGLVSVELAGARFPTGAVPSAVQNIVLACASRGYINPMSYSSESADDWSGSNAPIREMGFFLTGTEKSVLASFTATHSGFGSARVTRADLGGRGVRECVDLGGRAFPWYGEW